MSKNLVKNNVTFLKLQKSMFFTISVTTYWWNKSVSLKYLSGIPTALLYIWRGCLLIKNVEFAGTKQNRQFKINLLVMKVEFCSGKKKLKRLLKIWVKTSAQVFSVLSAFLWLPFCLDLWVFEGKITAHFRINNRLLTLE